MQVEDGQAWKMRAEKLGRNLEDLDEILHHQGLFYVLKIIKTELINIYHNNPLPGYFGIKKIWELVTRTYYMKLSTMMSRSMSEAVISA